MPAITIQSLELTEEQKVILAEKFTRIFSEVSHVPEDKIYLFFLGYPLDSAAKGGVLFSKNPPQFGVGQFSPK
ncbi:hypothetical protein JXQ70_01675 [bacterium]|nr:hypothetical protein [bacterium]